MSGSHFADRLLEAIERKKSHVVVGLDPDFSLLPPELTGGESGLDAPAVAALYREFLSRLITGLTEEAVAVKLQIAYFEALGSIGYALYEEMIDLAKQAGYLVIADVKRGDIGSTAEAYAKAHLDVAGADAVTVNPYFGSDGLEPFFKRVRGAGKGVFLLVKTSNPSSSEIQDLQLASGMTVYEHVASLVNAWGADSVGIRGYSSVGAVVGGTHPEQGASLRFKMPRVPLLVPGFGAQGATAADLARMFDGDGTGAVVNSSRAILYAYRKHGGDWLDAARAEAAEMRSALWEAVHGD